MGERERSEYILLLGDFNSKPHESTVRSSLMCGQEKEGWMIAVVVAKSWQYISISILITTKPRWTHRQTMMIHYTLHGRNTM